MKNNYTKYLHPFIVSFFMTFIMSFTGLYVHKGFEKGFMIIWFRSFIIMLPISYVSIFFIIPFSKFLTDKICNKFKH